MKDRPIVTPRQRTILGMMALGYGRKQIADALFVEECTVRDHMNNCYARLGLTGIARPGYVAVAMLCSGELGDG